MEKFTRKIDGIGRIQLSGEICEALGEIDREVFGTQRFKECRKTWERSREGRKFALPECLTNIGYKVMTIDAMKEGMLETYTQGESSSSRGVRGFLRRDGAPSIYRRTPSKTTHKNYETR